MSAKHSNHPPQAPALNEADTCRQYVLPRLVADGQGNAQGQRQNAKVNRAQSVSAFPHFPCRQRADRVKRQQAAFFKYFKPEAQEILRDLTGNHDSRQRKTPVRASISWQRWERQYASDGELQLVAVHKHLPDVLRLPPISHHGNVNRIIGKFGGADQLRTAVKLTDYAAKKVWTHNS